MTTAYDLVAYPTTIHTAAHPDRLAVAARLAGMDPAPMERARVLEIGGGSCFGLIAFAAIYPESTCHGFDLAGTAIDYGRRLAGDCCPNLTLEVDDITTAKEHFEPQSFDYVIAHGVYAWVPPHVQQALLDLISHVLAPQGVAFVSYNALPGGHIRMILREMLLLALSGIDDSERRIEVAREVLEQFGEPRDGDDPAMQGLRHHARLMLDRPTAVLFHDELGSCFDPQSLSGVVAAAEGHGLRFLTDGGPNRGFDGFLTDAQEVADPDHEVVKVAQLRDYMEMCWFRVTLLVRAEASPVRYLEQLNPAGLWISTGMKALPDNEFSYKGDIMAIADDTMAARLRELVDDAPGRRRIEDIAVNDDQIAVLMQLYRRWAVQFHTCPAPFVTEPGKHPRANRWLRDLLERGEGNLANLMLRHTRIDQQEIRILLQAADGTRSIADLCAVPHGIPASDVPQVLAAAARQGLLEQ